jgi:hypothetical protein
MELIIRAQEVNLLSRPISQHIDESLINAYIREVQELIVKPALGKQFAEAMNDCERKALIERATAYYVYAKIVKYGATITTRFGAVEKDDEYSTRIEQQRKDDIFRECNAIGDSLLRSAMVEDKCNEGTIPPVRKTAYIVGE